MARKTVDERIAEEQQRLEAGAAKLKRLKQQKAQADRKADTRRKVIYGAIVLEHMALNKDPNFNAYIERLMDKAVTRKIDRKFLGLDDRKPSMVDEANDAAAHTTETVQ